MRSLWNPWVQLFFCANAALIANLNRFFSTSSPDVLQKLPPELSGEWTDFFIDGIYSVMLPLPIGIAGMIYSCFNSVWTTLNGLGVVYSEWFDFFFLVGITDAFSEPDDPVFPLAVLQSVGQALTFVPIQKLMQNNLRPRFIAGQKTNLPDGLQTLLNTFCPQLLFKARPLQITTFHLLDK